MKGKLYGIGVGPGDPELLTLKAKRLIEECDIVAYFDFKALSLSESSCLKDISFSSNSL